MPRNSKGLASNKSVQRAVQADCKSASQPTQVHIAKDYCSISENAFVPGRLITDNVLLAYELTHHLRNKREGKHGLAAFKLDMSKAYDRVEWSFLERIMRKMGFAEKWIRLIMLCVTTVSYKIRINGECTETIWPQRGLRQGDPLSPYLFIICAEAFSALMEDAERRGQIEELGSVQAHHVSVTFFR